MKTLEVKITGICPILFHNVESMLLKKPSSIKHDEWEKSEEVKKARLYWTPEGLLHIPDKNITAMMIRAAANANIKMGKKSMKDALRSLIFPCVDLNGNPKYFTLGAKLKDVTEHQEFVSIQRNKILRIFPMLEKWSGGLCITYDESLIGEDVLLNILSYAGKFTGLGDYRPRFGRFSVKK